MKKIHKQKNTIRLLLIFVLFCFSIKISAAAASSETPTTQTLLKKIDLLEKRVDLLKQEVKLLRKKYSETEKEKNKLILFKKVRELEEKVSKIRGLQLLSHVDFEQLSAKDLRKYVLNELNETIPDELAKDYTFCLYQLGFLEEIVDLIPHHVT